MINKYCILFFSLFFFISCNKSSFFADNSTDYLTSNPWVLKRFVYTDVNEILDLGCNIYNFDSNNDFYRTRCSDGEVISSGTWKLLYNNAYLQIGPNVYKINFLSKRVLTLQHGNVEIYLLPIK